jgi:hypothetical protein
LDVVLGFAYVTDLAPEASMTDVVRLSVHGSLAIPGRQSQTVLDAAAFAKF